MWRHRWRAAALAVLVLAAAGCDESPTEVEGIATYAIEVSGERFLVRVAVDAQVEAFDARLAAGGHTVINGPLVAGDGGFNQPWSWHLDPDEVHVADLSIELCDGRPSLIEADLPYWFDSVKQFCPWGARIVERVD